MPYLRFSKDKRGYETTFLVHTEKRRGRSRSRILYFFRSPAGVKVGRPAFDEDAIRSIEERNPDVEFDWTRILQGQPEPTPAKEARPLPERRERRTERTGRSGNRPGEERARLPRAAPPAGPAAAEPAMAVPDAAITGAPGPAPGGNPEGLPPQVLDAVGATADVPPEPAAAMDTTPSAASDRLGFEGQQRLRARYAEILARISERGLDAERQAQLRTDAERLNPDAWVTPVEVDRGLEQYESALESLRAVIGQRRRRRRRSGRTAETAPGAPPPDEDASVAPDDAGRPGAAAEDEPDPHDSGQ